jgi:hypothetical protein
VAAEFDKLVNLAAKVDNIQITDDEPLMLTQAQYDASASTLAKFTGGNLDIQIIA